MNNLKVGFARADITPELGAPVDGYTFMRYSEGVLDSLEVNTIAFSDGSKTAILAAIDVMLISNDEANGFRDAISRATGVDFEAIYLSATHTHTAPGGPRKDQNEIADRFYIMLKTALVDTAKAAIADLTEAKMGFGVGKAENVSFCRRFIMKDGSCRTNPGVDNPDILRPVSEVDTRVSVLRFKREGKDDICLVNFANHPDTVGGNMISADWPGAMRRTVERVYDDVKCVFVNGAQGDINHVNVHPTGGYANDTFIDFDDVARGYGHTQYIGRVVAAGVMQAYDKVEYIDVESISAANLTIAIPANKASEEELPEARRIWQLHLDGRDDEIGEEGMMLTTVVAEARRMVSLSTAPDNFNLTLSAIRLGDVALIGIPGEPFSVVGTEIKARAGYKLVMPTCITGGYQGYFPSIDAYREGGYESRSSLFAPGVAERIIDGALELAKLVK